MLEFIASSRDMKKCVHQQNAVISISMVSPIHTGENFQKIINWYNQQTNFRRCFIYLADTLNRFNHMLVDKISEEDALVKARRFGDKWLNYNEPILNKIKTQFFIIRWDDQTRTEVFLKNRETLNALMKENDQLRNAVRKDINAYFARRGIQADMIYPREYELYQKYIIEELAADSILYDKYPAAWIYPGKELECFKLLRAGKIEGAPTGLQNCSYLRLIGTGSQVSEPITGSSNVENLSSIKHAA